MNYRNLTVDELEPLVYLGDSAAAMEFSNRTIDFVDDARADYEAGWDAGADYVAGEILELIVEAESPAEALEAIKREAQRHVSDSAKVSKS